MYKIGTFLTLKSSKVFFKHFIIQIQLESNKIKTFKKVYRYLFIIRL